MFCFFTVSWFFECFLITYSAMTSVCSVCFLMRHFEISNCECMLGGTYSTDEYSLKTCPCFHRSNWRSLRGTICAYLKVCASGNLAQQLWWMTLHNKKVLTEEMFSVLIEPPDTCIWINCSCLLQILSSLA